MVTVFTRSVAQTLRNWWDWNTTQIRHIVDSRPMAPALKNPGMQKPHLFYLFLRIKDKTGKKHGQHVAGTTMFLVYKRLWDGGWDFGNQGGIAKHNRSLWIQFE